MVYIRPDSYYNSMDLEPETILVYLSNGRREPQTESEKIMLEEIKEIESKGYELDIPFNGL